MVHERNDGKIEEKDEARTPLELFHKFDRIHHFNIDLFTDGKTNMLCKRFIAPDAAGGFLNPDLHLKSTDIGYGNPPYSPGMIPKITKKCYEESRDTGATIGILIPADTSTVSFHEWVCGWDMKLDRPKGYGAAVVTFLFPRVIFNRPSGISFDTAPKFGSMFVLYKRDIYDGNTIFTSMGWKK